MPGDGGVLGLSVECRVENVVTGVKLSQVKTVSVQCKYHISDNNKLLTQYLVPPRDLSISGPVSGEPGDHVIVHCHSSPSVPPAQLSWIVSPSVTNMETTETVHQEEDGSFTTMTSISLDVPDHSVEDVVLRCVGSHATAPEEALNTVHVIKISGESCLK